MEYLNFLDLGPPTC